MYKSNGWSEMFKKDALSQVLEHNKQQAVDEFKEQKEKDKRKIKA